MNGKGAARESYFLFSFYYLTLCAVITVKLLALTVMRQSPEDTYKFFPRRSIAASLFAIKLLQNPTASSESMPRFRFILSAPSTVV